MGYHLLILKDSVTHMHGLAICVKEKLPFAWELSLEKLCRLLRMFLTGFTLLIVLLFFPLFPLFLLSSSLCMVFNVISSNIDGFFSINPSANVFVFGDFNVYHRFWLAHCGETDRPVECRWLTFLLKPLTVTLTVLCCWIYFFVLMLVFVIQL